MEIYAQTLSEAWEISIKKLIDDQKGFVYTQRGVRAKEILAMQLIVENPLKEPMLSMNYAFGEMFIEKYCSNILEASCGENSIHNRIIKEKSIKEKSINQLLGVIDCLKREPDSRRAIISLWDSENDIKSKHPPCACLIQFMIRNNKLNTIAYFRSNDSWMAVLPDMIAITKISKIIAASLDVHIGQYIHLAASYHLYEPDLVPAIICFERRS